MTGFDSKRQAALDKLFEVENELVLSYGPEQKRPIESDYISHVAYTRALEAYCDSLEQPATHDNNFCPRCGKRRGGDVNYFHTCTSPRGLEMT